MLSISLVVYSRDYFQPLENPFFQFSLLSFIGILRFVYLLITLSCYHRYCRFQILLMMKIDNPQRKTIVGHNLWTRMH
jgi:hypothetical protein